MHNCITDALNNRIQNIAYLYLEERLDNQLLILNEVRYFEIDIKIIVDNNCRDLENQFGINIQFGELRMLPKDRDLYCDSIAIIRKDEKEGGKPGDGYIAAVYLNLK